jgi:hypothetical protein
MTFKELQPGEGRSAARKKPQMLAKPNDQGARAVTRPLPAMHKNA